MPFDRRWRGHEDHDPLTPGKSFGDQLFHSGIGPLAFVANAVLIETRPQTVVGKPDIDHNVVDNEGIDTGISGRLRVELELTLRGSGPLSNRQEAGP